ncbi:Outer membrane beta-barrel protein [Rhodovastum atsumiense]|uniref:Outer membrane beta-barrel protein n=1 Tax=Rhodovastum atsumiense TaxID=504468 RepID=A0A5M6IR58_9PROT|nr:outer membrane beta-barrel protein [Rhodovastum atsumiense]KAA5610774.1 outer membrane beta-barrel protein [Rhodovastum atsumiense]CAH2604440.1 Outer membrane beta-barrel protein [Rhodovastum atsumiense]
MSRSRLNLLFAGLPCASALIASTASAQPVGQFLLDRYFPEGTPGYYVEPGVTVQSRMRPEYDAPGIRAGSFIIRPRAIEGIGYNDNVLGSINDKKSSLVINSQASLTANSDWGRNSLGASISVEDSRYPSVNSQNTTVWNGSLGGTYDIGRDQVQLGYTHLSGYVTPTSVDARRYITRPAPYDLDNAHIGYYANFGRFALLPSFDYTQLRFSPADLGTGAQVSQSYQNRNVYRGAVQGRYEFAPQRNAVLEVRTTGTDYVSSTAMQGHNSLGYAVLVGLDYASSAVWRFRGLIGYEIRDFQSSAFKQRTSPVGEANVIWTPTGLTTVTGRVARTIEDSSDPAVAGYDYTSTTISIDHEYLRNVILSGYVGYQRADYIGSPASQTFYSLGVGAAWLIDRNFRLGLNYSLINQTGDTGGSVTSPVRGGSYLQNITLLNLRFQL